MKLVIEIPNSVYEKIIDGTIETDGYFKANLRECFRHGTPLPKGHGDLVDRNYICKAIYAADDNCTGMGMTYDEMDIYNDGIDSMWNKLQNAAPIIKADKEVLDEDSD